MPRSRKGQRSPARLIVPLALGFTLGGVITARSPTDTIDPPPVNETALAARLFEMTRPEPGERALIVYDPTYYPGSRTVCAKRSTRAASRHTWSSKTRRR